MEFWDQTVAATKKFISVAEKKTEEIVNVQKLNFKISSTQNKINEKYRDLGKTVYTALQSEQSLNAEILAESKAEIDVLKKELQKLNKELADAKGKVNCPKCGAACDAKSSFCHQCGGEL